MYLPALPRDKRVLPRVIEYVYHHLQEGKACRQVRRSDLPAVPSD